MSHKETQTVSERATRSEHFKCELIKTAGKVESRVGLPWQLTVHGDKGYTSSPARRRSEATRAAKHKHKYPSAAKSSHKLQTRFHTLVNSKSLKHVALKNTAILLMLVKA